MMRESEIKERARNAGYLVEDEGDSFTVWTSPYKFVVFIECGVDSIPFAASSASFERSLLEDIDYFHMNAKKNEEV